MPSAGHEIHGKELLGEVRSRLVEYSPVARVNVMAADLAGICPPLGHRVKLAALLADGAICGRAPILDFHELGQTRCIVWVLSLELLEGVFGHRSYPLPWRVGIPQPRADLL